MDCKTLPLAPVRKWESGSRGGRPAFYLYVGPGDESTLRPLVAFVWRIVSVCGFLGAHPGVFITAEEAMQWVENWYRAYDEQMEPIRARVDKMFAPVRERLGLA